MALETRALGKTRRIIEEKTRARASLEEAASEGRAAQADEKKEAKREKSQKKNATTRDKFI